MEAARRGDRPALERIYQRYSPRVAGYLRSHGVIDVGGTTNDVFFRVFKGLATFEGDEPKFRSWVFTIAHHLMVDELRRAARRPRSPMRPALTCRSPGATPRRRRWRAWAASGSTACCAGSRATNGR